MEISRVAEQNAEIYRQMELKKLDRRHEELRLEAERVKERIKDLEDKRIEMNRQMNRAGQNVDKLA
jgi:hypothetical protein